MGNEARDDESELYHQVGSAVDGEGDVVTSSLIKGPGATGVTCGAGPFAYLVVRRLRYKRGYH